MGTRLFQFRQTTSPKSREYLRQCYIKEKRQKKMYRSVMGKIKEGTNKYHTITTVLTDTFMGIHNYAYMNILMNTSFQKQNNLTGLQGPLSPCTDVIFSLISVLENTHYSEFFITFYAKILSKDILSYFI